MVYNLLCVKTSSTHCEVIELKFFIIDPLRKYLGHAANAAFERMLPSLTKLLLLLVLLFSEIALQDYTHCQF